MENLDGELTQLVKRMRARRMESANHVCENADSAHGSISARMAGVDTDLGNICYPAMNGEALDVGFPTGTHDPHHAQDARGFKLTFPLTCNHEQQDKVNNANPARSKTPATKNVRKLTGLHTFFSQLIRGMTPTAILDLGAMGNFLKPGDGIPTGKISAKVVGMPKGQLVRAPKQVKLPMRQLSQAAKQGDELPGLQNKRPKIGD